MLEIIVIWNIINEGKKRISWGKEYGFLEFIRAKTEDHGRVWARIWRSFKIVGLFILYFLEKFVFQ